MGQAARRRFLLALGATALSSPLLCKAQAAKLPQIGILVEHSSRSEWAGIRRPQFEDSLRRAGYDVDKDIQLIWRYAEGKRGRLDALAVDLVRQKVDVIVAFASGAAANAASRATSTIPIVTYAMDTRTAIALAGENFARPSRNITGTLYSSDASDEILKRIEILKNAAPYAVRVASIEISQWRSAEHTVPEHLVAKEKFGLVFTNFPIGDPQGISSALDRIARLEPEALYVGGGLSALSKTIAEFALRKKLVSIGSSPRFVRAGGLLFFGPNIPAMLDRTAIYVSRVLRGAQPMDLPLEYPTEYVVMFNARTAKAIGYTPPPAFLIRIDEVVE